MHFLLASRNRHKIRELEDILAADISGVAVHSLDEVGFSGDIDENGTTFDENARIKARVARAAALRAGHPDWYCLGDDSGLSVDALGGAPGAYSARFAGQHGDDLAQASSPSVRSFVHYKGNFHKNQEEKSSFLNNFHQIVQNQIHHFPFRPFADLRASSGGKNPSKKGVAPTRKLRYNAICKNTGESP